MGVTGSPFATPGNRRDVASASSLTSRLFESQKSKSEAREWTKPAARAGLAARAVLYAVITILACFVVADGFSPSQTSGEGALAEVAKQPIGPELLGLLAVGLLAYALWRLMQAVFGVEPAESDRPPLVKRFGWLCIAGLYLTLLSEAISILSGSGGGSVSNHPQSVAATLLAWPGGPGWLGVVAVALIAGGVSLAVWGALHNEKEELETGQMSPWVLHTTRVTGIAGNVTRGGLLVAVGVYFMTAAVEDTPSKVKSLDQLFETTVRVPGGAWWAGLAAVGLACFAVFSAFEARYRRV